MSAPRGPREANGPHAGARSRARCLVGFDAVGFSGYVEALALAHGRHAGELAAATLFRAEQAIGQTLAEAGFRWVDALGDGAIYATDSALHDGALDRLIAAMAKTFEAQTGRKARTAWARGQLNETPLDPPLREHASLVWGEAVARLHRTLHRTRSAGPSAHAKATPATSIAALSARSASEGDVERQAFVFFRLAAAEHWHALDVEKLHRALSRLSGWAGGFGGRLERITQDEKGLHLRLAAPVWTLAKGWGRDLDTPREALRALGYDGAAALAVGPVYTGVSVSGARAVCGVAVNRAAKLCAAAGAGEIVIDESARAWIERVAPAAPTAGIERNAVIADGLAWLDDALAQGGARGLLIEGPPGIGKTHVLDRTLEDLAARRDVAITMVQAGVALGLRPFGLVTDLARHALGVFDTSEEHAFARDALARVGAASDSLHLISGALRNGVPEAPGLAALTPGERAAATEAAFAALLEALARRAPHAFAVDDIHNADTESVAVLEQLFRRAAPLILIATARPSESAHVRLATTAGTAWRTSTLAPLARDAFAALVRANAPNAPPAWIAALYTASDGAPFFAIQSAAAFAARHRNTAGEPEGEAIGDGAMNGADDDAGNGAASPDLMHIDPLDLALDARIDSLGDNERAVMRALALINRPISPALLAAMTSDGDAPLDHAILARLVNARLARWAPGASLAGDSGGSLGGSSGLARHGERAETPAIAAAHALLVEAVAQRTPRSVRTMLARRAARAVQASTPRGGMVDNLPEVARLWSEGGDRARAALCYERAAAQAARQGSHATAIQLATLALGQFPASPAAPAPRRALRWLAERAVAEWSIGRITAANESARTCLTIARARPLPDRLRRFAAAAVSVRAETGQFMGAPGEILSAAADARRFAGDTPEASTARGRSFAFLGYFFALVRLDAVARRYFDMGEKLAMREDGRRGAAFTLTARAVIDLSQARWADGTERLERARSLLPADGEHQLHEVIATTTGMAAHLQGDHVGAIAQFAYLGKLAIERRNTMHVGWSRYATAQTLLMDGRYDPAWTLLQEAQSLLDGIEDNHSHHICTGLEARLRFERGDHEGALAAAERALALSNDLPPTNYTSLEACSAAALVSGLVMLSPGAGDHRARAHRLSASALAPLKRFALLFPIGRPRLAALEALARAAHHGRDATRRLDRALARARSMNMSGEVALFTRLGAMMEGARARSQEKRNG